MSWTKDLLLLLWLVNKGNLLASFYVILHFKKKTQSNNVILEIGMISLSRHKMVISYNRILRTVVHTKSMSNLMAWQGISHLHLWLFTNIARRVNWNDMTTTFCRKLKPKLIWTIRLQERLLYSVGRFLLSTTSEYLLWFLKAHGDDNENGNETRAVMINRMRCLKKVNELFMLTFSRDCLFYLRFYFQAQRGLSILKTFTFMQCKGLEPISLCIAVTRKTFYIVSYKKM